MTPSKRKNARERSPFISQDGDERLVRFCGESFEDKITSLLRDRFEPDLSAYDCISILMSSVRVSSAGDLYGSLHDALHLRCKEIDDKDALASDWKTIGDDLRFTIENAGKIMVDYEEEPTDQDEESTFEGRES